MTRSRLLTFAAAAALAAGGLAGGEVSANHATSDPEYADDVVDFGRFSDKLFARGPHGTGGSPAYDACEDGTITSGKGSPQLNALGEPDGTGGAGWFNLGDGQSGDGSVACTNSDFDEGFIELEFTNNVGLPDGDTGTGDLSVWEASGPFAFDGADVFVSFDGSSFAFVGTAVSGTNDGGGGLNTHENTFDLDATGLAAVRFVRLINAGDPDSDTGAKGFDLDSVEATNSFNFGTAHIVKANTGSTTIKVTDRDGFDDQQFFTFEITITNALGEDLSDIVFLDTVPGEFDVSSAIVTSESDVDDCTAAAFENEHGNQKLAPDFVEITADGLTTGQNCTVTVDVGTDNDHPGKGNNPEWTPTSCNTGTIVLNEGVQVFRDENDDEMVDGDDTLLFQDNDSLELSCVFS